MKTTETREDTLARLAKDARKDTSAAKRFETLVRRVAKTPTSAASAKKNLRSNFVSRPVAANSERLAVPMPSLWVATTSYSQPRALPPAVADLGSR